MIRAALRNLVRFMTSLRLRNEVRLACGLYPRTLRERYPDLESVGLRRNAVVVDVGANVGDFAECVLAFQPWARLHLIEPLSETLPVLRSKFGEYSGVSLGTFALGSEPGEREFFVCQYDQASSFLETGAALKAGAYGLDFSRKEVRRVPVRTLVDYLREARVDHVDLLKLDVQGFELEVLRGAGDALGRIDWIYAEAQFQELYRGGPLFSDVFEYLQTRGFELLRMTSFRVDEGGRLLECDMLFRRRRTKEDVS